MDRRRRAHTRAHARRTRSEVRRLLSLHLDRPRRSFFLFLLLSPHLFCLHAHRDVLCLHPNLSGAWLRSLFNKTKATHGRMDEWLDGRMDGQWACGWVCNTSSGFNICSSSHILGCFNMNSYLWKAMNEHNQRYWLQH